MGFCNPSILQAFTISGGTGMIEVMFALILRRLLTALVTLFLVISLTFVLLRMMPGGPFDQEHRLPPAIQKRIEERYHLNEPLWKQYALYMSGVLRGDLGPSYKYRSRMVIDII